MNLIVVFGVAFVTYLPQTTVANIKSNVSDSIDNATQNKSKRTIATAYVRNYGDDKPILIYTDNIGAASSDLSGLYVPVTIKPIFDPESSKQVSAQQVVYEFQQTPTNAVSNVHVNQFYHPVPSSKQQDDDESTSAITGSETMAAPVQHSSIVRHGQNQAQVQYHPLQISPHHIQTQQYIPGKYLYVNGKIVYQPNQLYNQNYQPKTLYNFTPPKQNLSPPPPAAPLSYQRNFNPPPRHQYQDITKPMISTPPPRSQVKEVKEEHNEEQEEEELEEDNAPVKHDEEEEVEEEDDDRASYEESEDDDDHERFFGKYSFDVDDGDDEEGNRQSYRTDEEEEEEDDADRKSSKQIPKTYNYNYKKKPKRTSKHSKYSESYSTNSKFQSSKPRKNKHTNRHRPYYQATTKKYFKTKPKKQQEKIQGKQSENIPIVHKHKIYREKWYVTKNSEEGI